MNSTTNGSPLAGQNWLLANKTALRAYPSAALWRLWWRIGRALAARGAAAVSDRFERARQRRDLHDLDLHLLRDIGVTSRRSKLESDKFFWIL
jgi:uncharacterized protein YjiS (DUF1127 family)